MLAMFGKLAFNLDLVLDKFLAIRGCRQHISPTRFSKLIIHTNFADQPKVFWVLVL